MFEKHRFSLNESSSRDFWNAATTYEFEAFVVNCLLQTMPGRIATVMLVGDSRRFAN